MFSSRIGSSFTTNRFTQTLIDLRRRGAPLLDLTESNPTCAGFDYPADLLASLSDPKGLIYAPSALGAADAREAVAADYARRGMTIGAERIVLTASTSDAYSLLFKVLCDPGDEVLVPRPSYPLFEHLTQLDGVRAVPYDLEYVDRWRIDLESVTRSLSSRSRVMLMVHPNNPTGSFALSAEFDSAAELCAAQQVAIVADEVFADYELTPDAHRAAANTLKPRETLVFSLGGLSKSVGLPQVKLGWMAIAGPSAIVDAAMERLELACDTYLSVSTGVQTAARDLLTRGASVRRQIQERVAANYRRLLAESAARPACRVLHADAGWYGVIQVPAIGKEEDLVVDLLRDEGVVTHPGYFFDFPREAFLVVSLLAPERAFASGTERVFRHFDCSQTRP